MDPLSRLTRLIVYFFIRVIYRREKYSYGPKSALYEAHCIIFSEIFCIFFFVNDFSDYFTFFRYGPVGPP
jgi:hypothetical protein